ncbi:hypothetical protein SAMD00019534_012810 [Acytostelium subglobosum LB1]|uniref:hypothetical protein n=1 Tax=Acytostelium subglobosum LB1 TaxID=1410327 RepID=UPI000644FE42|nr:hypothetical protein SAMD00019534_012810 [Acytostelium subglobosum LB1]GAM18106.1 hypothetical protein SAMD00019534_012810 [Acytostelium subglobosum LB1]|eukprot:XP_012758702.1 hypothetical protein SAMD00019534_012810 [Acytostelium subglobosum LB1]
MNVKLSCQKFPVNPSVKDASGAIWCHANSAIVDRCQKCFAYINSYVNPGGSQHGYNNGSSSSSPIMAYGLREELMNNNIVLHVNDDQQHSVNNINAATAASGGDLMSEEYNHYKNNPIYVAVIDQSGNPEQMETIRNGLEALVHALPDNCLFGMAIYSHRIGLFNLNDSVPMLKYIDVVGGDSALAQEISFDDILPLTSFLVNKAECETNILNAINILTDGVNVAAAAASNSTTKKGGNVRTLGPLVSRLLDYLSFDNITFNVKVGVFLNGCPSYGDGVVENDFTSVEALYDEQLKASFLLPSNNFFQRQAERATQVGVHFDMYCIGNNFYGFDTIKFLSTSTGGNLYRYTNLSPKCPLPQDIYKLISNGWGFHGLMRVRTSQNFSVDNCFGNVIASKNYDNLYHIESCSPFTSIAFDFKFTDPSAFEGDKVPFIQVAFSYSFLPPVESSNNNDEQQVNEDTEHGTQSNIRTIQRRLHIYNFQIPVALNPVEMFNSIDLETTISLLTHKVIKESLEKGIGEARVLLYEWIANIITQYNEHVVILSSVQKTLDIMFSQVQHLRPLPRYVFALLKSPLLQQLNKTNEIAAINRGSDDWVFCQCLYQSLEPRLLHRAIYPTLNTYGAPNNLAYKYLPLSENSISVSVSHIYLMDAYDKMIVYYSPQVSSQHPFPPPADSLIRQTIANSKQDRLVVPEIIYTRGHLSSEGGRQFSDYLIEEDNWQGQSFNEFLKDLGEGIKKVLQE